MPDFEEVPSVAFGGYVVLGQPTSIDTFEVVGGAHAVYATEAEATQVAQAKVGNPDNWYRTRVCKPDGSGFGDIV